MLGVNRTVVDGRIVAFEYLRIEASGDGGATLLASPGGRHPPTSFRLVTRAADRATFENPKQLAVGIHHVIVNGEPVLRDGDPTGARPDRGLRRSTTGKP